MDEYPKLINSFDDSVITINNSSFSIGRSLSCDHIIQALGVSRFHCIIKKIDDKWTLFDRSTNGTMVNKSLYKFNESVVLNNGDIIKLGPDNLDFVFADSKASQREGKSSQPEEGTPEEQIDSTAEVLLEEAASLLAADFESPFNVVEIPPTTSTTAEIPLENPNPSPTDDKIELPKQLNTKTGNSQNLDIMENELTCSICSELFIKAVTLSCSHTFCKFCIEEWRKNKSTCPICRKAMTTIAPTLVLDNFIDKFISTQTDEVKEMRKVLIQQREDAIVNTAGSSSNMPTTTMDMVEAGSIIEILSEDDDDDDDEDSDYNYYSDDHDYDVYDCYFDNRPYVGSRGRYYGGYGRCFVCSQTGHWANSCPFKRR